jgi:hypothetical protein
MVWIIIAVAVIAGITGIIVFLPVLLRAKLNRRLGSLKAFTGSIAHVRMDLFAGRITLTDLRMEHRNASPGQPPVAYIPYMRVSFRWKALLRKTLDLTIRAEDPQILLTARTADTIADAPAPTSDSPANFKNIIEPLRAFRIDLEVFNGTFNYTNVTADPAVDITISALHVRMQDFTNRADATHISPIDAGGTVYNGKLALHVDLQPLADTLTFDLNAAVRAVDLPLLNDYLRRYARVDVGAGTLDLYAELAVANNAFHGQVTPVLKDLNFHDASDQQDSFWQKIWERTVATGISLLANRSKGEIATHIPIHGMLDNPNVNVAAAIAGVFKNAFIRSIRPSLSDIISFGTLRKAARDTTKGFVQRIFGRKQKTKDQR